MTVVAVMLAARSHSIDKLNIDFTQSVVVDLRDKKQLEAVGKALRAHDLLVDQVHLQRDLIKKKDLRITDFERKAKLDKALKITGIVLGTLGGFAFGVGLGVGIAKLQR